jgi:hypothetical protein
VAPKRPEDILTELAEPLEPGAFGQGAQDARGQVLVPSARAGQLLGIDAAEERGEHQAEDCAKPLLLGSQAAFDLGDEVVGQAQIMESLVEGVNSALGLSLLALVAFFGIETPPCDGFGVLFDVSLGAGHGVFLLRFYDRESSKGNHAP